MNLNISVFGLSWNKHVNEICSTISPYIGLISRIRYYTTKKNLMDIYYSFIHSRITYCLPVWCSTNKNNLQKIQTKQNKVLKFINFKKNSRPHINCIVTNYYLLSNNASLKQFYFYTKLRMV
jgi:hypothetical protein